MGKHFVEAEELQAYLDRELAPARQVEVERHLAECRECAALVADLKRVSETLQQWQVERAPASLRPPAIEAGEAAPRWRWKRLTLALAGTGAVALLALWITVPDLLKSGLQTEPMPEPKREVIIMRPPSPAASEGRAEEQEPQFAAGGAPTKTPPAAEPAPPPASPAYESRNQGRRNRERVVAEEALSSADQAAPIAGVMANKAATAGRMIAYSVTMTVEVKEFEAKKQRLLAVVEEAGGYVAQAESAETPNQPQRAVLTVRVPVAQLNPVLEELRKLGRVTREQLASDEVTEQVVDLEARLRNGRATEQRLIDVLDKRTGKVGDILEVEREIARTRQGIERMDAQRQNLRRRVELATIHITLVEEFQAQLQPAPVGTRTRLRNAFVEGYESFIGMLLGFVFFLARYGLTLLFWLGLLWLGWRAMRRPVLRFLQT